MRGDHQTAENTEVRDIPAQSQSAPPKRPSLIESLLPLRERFRGLRLVTAPPPPNSELEIEIDDGDPELASEGQVAPRVWALPRIDTTRLLAGLALVCMLLIVFEALSAAYHALTDSFVTPIILSPDSDLVLPSKLSLAHLVSERQTQEVRITEAKQAIVVAEEGIRKLRDLQSTASQSLVWTDTVTSQSRAASASDLEMIDKQRRIMQAHISEQQAYVAELKRDMDAGLVRKVDLSREMSQLRQMRIAALDNERAHVASATTHSQNAMAEEALHQQSAKRSLVSPEMLQRKDQLVRIEMDLIKLQSDIEARRAELRVATVMATTLDELIEALKKRPVFRAIDTKQNVAFVPYTQSDSVRVGADVYSCGLFGMFACDSVGTVLEVLPGEINMEDPWGTPTRGQYALLDLRDPDAAKARSLRVRGGAEDGESKVVEQTIYGRSVQ